MLKPSGSENRSILGILFYCYSSLQPHITNCFNYYFGLFSGQPCGEESQGPTAREKNPVEEKGCRQFTNQDDPPIDNQEFVKDEIKKMRERLKGQKPDIDIGGHCSDPYGCDFGGHCWQHIPENSIFALGGNGPDKFELYRQGIIPWKMFQRIFCRDAKGFKWKVSLIKRCLPLGNGRFVFIEICPSCIRAGIEI